MQTYQPHKKRNQNEQKYTVPHKQKHNQSHQYQTMEKQHDIEWSIFTPDKDNCMFLQFDIVEFYPSIRKDGYKHKLEFQKADCNPKRTDIVVIFVSTLYKLFLCLAVDPTHSELSYLCFIYI